MTDLRLNFLLPVWLWASWSSALILSPWRFSLTLFLGAVVRIQWGTTVCKACDMDFGPCWAPVKPVGEEKGPGLGGRKLKTWFLGLCFVTYKLNEHPNIQWDKMHKKITSSSINVILESALQICHFHTANLPVMRISFVTRAWDGLNSDPQPWDTSGMLGQLAKLLLYNAFIARVRWSRHTLEKLPAGWTTG